MRVLISGGGTGGHIYPALSIIKEIKQQEPDSVFLYVGSSKGLEADIVPRENIPFQSIEVSGFRRKLSLDNLKTIYRFIKSVRESKKMIRDFKPNIVIGTGGYVCGPVVFAAARLGIPTLIHEQNVIPGLTNKFLSRFSSAIAVSFEGSASFFNHSTIEITGNPRATEVAQASRKEGRASLNLPLTKKIILIVGGSRGAKAINLAFLEMINQLPKLKDCHFVYVTGDVHYNEIREQVEKKGASIEQVTLKPFVYNMPDVLAATDLIVNRAGASFLAEITSLGIPSILIPSPYVTNNHQEKNARWLEEKGAAKVILEKELNGDILYQSIAQLMQDENELKKMSTASRQVGYPEAAHHIYQLMKKIVQNEKH
ncbi:undecaprenyldiphospho-muramoylpentapeptide beta-N-acetylglucosaminyltransferase [Caldalkalibacillus mannanilyticus]|uniref:undecaprenyldiphospho-muramoylpentapeptide beta-N-acetylglucosaminyltransferase n=1 Tax=Caldalkalibacillus mannanilyticus TaxID=1418 RepID=UPI00046933F6|nr:undecaprenyldiphospho-muramoylpentapeptide beta-N-acetylglucosaminyltransferase [Caldalkalibacillus mannanilyticus]